MYTGKPVTYTCSIIRRIVVREDNFESVRRVGLIGQRLQAIREILFLIAGGNNNGDKGERVGVRLIVYASQAKHEYADLAKVQRRYNE